MRIVLLGAAGSGKGTQATMIKAQYGIPHISTGDIFRAHIAKETNIGMEAKTYISKGLLVPDELTLMLVETRFLEDDCKDGFLLDGFPRNMNQAQALDVELEKLKEDLHAVIYLEVSDEALLKRALSREYCPKCGAIYNTISSKPTKKGICDKCTHELIRRSDDTESAMHSRLNVYREESKALEAYYQKRGILHVVNGEKAADAVFKDIEEILNGFK